MRHQYQYVFISVCFLLPINTVYAAGFALGQSVGSAGLAGAGSAVLAADATTQYTNPAAMEQIADGKNVSANITSTKTSTTISNAYASVLDSSTNTGVAFAGTNNGNMTPSALRPSIFYTFPIKDYLGYKDLKGGLALYSPFGFNNNYEDTFAGRLFADKTKLNIQTLAANLSIPLFDNKDLTFGAGYLLSRATGTVSKTLNTTGAHMTLSALDTASYDYNLGMFFKASPKLNIGATFTPQKKFYLGGTTKVTTSAEAAVAAKAATGTTAAVAAVPAYGSLTLNGSGGYDMTMPSSYELAASYQISPTVTAYGSTTRVRWSSIQTLAISTGLTSTSIKSQLANQLGSSFTESNLTSIASTLATKYGTAKSTALNFKNTNGYALGGSWQINPTWLLRGGIAIDASPTGYESRTVLLPLGSTRTVATGANYVINSTLNIDMAYNLTFNNIVAVNQKDTNGVDSYFGNFKGKEQSIAIQVNKRF